MNEDYDNVAKAYNSTAGTYGNAHGDKKWIIDVDDSEFYCPDFLTTIDFCMPKGDKFLAKIPTKNGYHLVVKPFNINEMEKFMKELGTPFDSQMLHKDALTLLYFPE